MFRSGKAESKDSSRPRQLLKIVLVLGLLVLFLGLVFVFWVSQPLLGTIEISGNAVIVSTDELEKHVRILSEDFHPRNYKNIENLNKSADYIKEAFLETGGNVTEQSFVVDENKYRNILVSYGSESKKRIVIGAHYDSCCETPGADDNASGVAGLLELARLFGRTKPAMQIELVAYSLEEPPFFSTEQMGSFVHAKSLKDAGIDVSLMISFEMIGYFSDEVNSQEFPVPGMGFIYPTKGNFVSVVGNFSNIFTVREFKRLMSSSTDLPVYSINAPASLPGIDFSDHKNYWHFGYDAIMITDTAFFRNRNYHTEKDNAESLDYERMAKVVRGTYQTVIHHMAH